MKHPKPRIVHTSDIRKADHEWLMLGGRIEHITGTGETRYRHDALAKPLRINGRRNDVPAKLMTLLNQVAKMAAANDPHFRPAD